MISIYKVRSSGSRKDRSKIILSLYLNKGNEDSLI